MNREVNLTKLVQTQAGKRYCPVVLSANGRIKPNYVYVDGREEMHVEGAYYIDWREKEKRIRKTCGKNPSNAMAERLRKEAELNAINNGIILPDAPDKGRSLGEAIDQYLNEVDMMSKSSTHRAYSKALEYFQESCKKATLEKIDRNDLIKFANYMRDEKEQADRSVYNKFLRVMIFLKAVGIKGLVKKTDWPRYTEEEVEIYEDHELEALFAACTLEEKVWFEFFLMSGMREMEVVHMTWADINFHSRTLMVRHKPEMNWTPKAYREREIPMSSRLAATLLEWKKESKPAGNSLVFHTKPGGIIMHFLDFLKAVAKRAGMEEDVFWLHKFRATFATKALWSGVDLRTVQMWLGHKDIKSTMRYLKPARGQKAQEQMNVVFA